MGSYSGFGVKAKRLGDGGGELARGEGHAKEYGTWLPPTPAKCSWI